MLFLTTHSSSTTSWAQLPLAEALELCVNAAVHGRDLTVRYYTGQPSMLRVTC